MPSRKSDKEALPSLSFEAPQPSDFSKMGKQELEPLNNRTITVLSGSSAGISETQNLIRYLAILSSNADAANVLTNGPIMLVLVKVLRLSKTPAFRVQIASLIGLLIRHSTAIEDELASSGILDSLANGLRDKHEKVGAVVESSGNFGLEKNCEDVIDKGVNNNRRGFNGIGDAGMALGLVLRCHSYITPHSLILKRL
ncbi:hypothetical protein Bca52824_062348 [Brassica carinata]|uniref:Uncharacterized protein n=1 Tax=Brassica carinata TaxID=52824 RepID=A0A8X7QE15_BRACI|nr:hypothetical protein Bca52824_062348 [Brassica carinata]